MKIEPYRRDLLNWGIQGTGATALASLLTNDKASGSPILPHYPSVATMGETALIPSSYASILDPTRITDIVLAVKDALLAKSQKARGCCSIARFFWGGRHLLN